MMDELNRRRNGVIRYDGDVVRHAATGEKKAAAEENADKRFHVAPYTDVFSPTQLSLGAALRPF